MKSEILGPVIVLVGWSLVMLFWLVIARMPAMKRAGIDVKTVTGGRPGALDGVVADRAQWKAHNYIHLMEQPTIFYAIALVLAMIGQGDGFNAQIAWAYVVLRILHSIVQATFNRVIVRFALFALSSVALLMLFVHAAMGYWGVSFH
ncbi:MAPEG family protein [Sphingomonas sp.]|uniref:MAPEG family protein n=1 Tax=Sphingomonas sp. TaxID=28214 RepID=UPI001ED57549|nr:MAPEG family protein [Sphingomonas sp.]MBX3595463.1 MAPEG family protein [Sphingomonas sp.]